MGIQVKGLEQFQRRVQELHGSLRNTTAVWQEIESSLNEEMNKSIAAQKSATTNQAYKELSEVTQNKYDKGPKDALKPANRVIIMERSGDNFIFKSTLPYSGVHQFGNPNNTYYGNKAPIPARSFLPITTERRFTSKFQKKVFEIIRNWFARISRNK